MRKKRLEAAIRRLMTDDAFRAAFRQDPERALGRYRLTPEEIEALKDGDTERLAAAGVDVNRWQGEPVSRSWAVAMLSRLAPAAAALMLLAGAAAPTYARPRFDSGLRMSRRARAILRARYRAGVAGLRRATTRQSNMGFKLNFSLPIDLVTEPIEVDTPGISSEGAGIPRIPAGHIMPNRRPFDHIGNF